jgi:hypothetical protein
VIRAHEQPQEIWKKYLDAAQKCQQEIDISAGRESFAQRSSRVLKELENETLHCIHRKDGYSHAVPVFTGLDGIRIFGMDTVMDRIDRWGFSSLTGY